MKKLNLKKMKKYFFLMIVFLPVSLCVGFMTVEAGDFYATLEGYNKTRGLIAGLLTEIFLALSAAVHFKDRKGLNIIIKTLMVCLFIATVAGSSLKVITPLLNKISTSNQQSKLQSFLILENKQNQQSLKSLKGQKTNTAIAVRETRKANEELKRLLRTEKTSWTAWLVIAISVFLRFGLQLSSLVWSHNLGVIYRTPERKKRVYKKKRKKTAKKKTPQTPKSKTGSKVVELVKVAQ